MSVYTKFNLLVISFAILYITPIAFVAIKYHKSGIALHNTQVRKIAHDLLTQCIPDYRARKIPVIVCYDKHGRYLKANLR